MNTPVTRRLLYVDDDVATARLVARVLARKGYETVVAANGPEAIAEIARGEPGAFDAIALDHYMPGPDGMEVLEQMTQRWGDALAPVIFVTGAVEPQLAVAAMHQGASDYVVKDVAGDFIALLAVAVDKAVERQAARREKLAAEQALRVAHDQMRELAQQRAMLLREVNHRVANSLQLIAAFARMQSNTLSDAAARVALEEMQGRIAAVAHVHRRLYAGGGENEDVRHLALDDYLRDLLPELFRSSLGLSWDLRTVPVTGSPDQAVALGVIVSELVTNAAKYAYPGGSGPIRLGLSRSAQEPNLACLTVEDDGAGYDEAAAPRGSGLGQRVVRAMTNSLGPEASLQRDLRHQPGTRILLRFAPAMLTPCPETMPGADA